MSRMIFGGLAALVLLGCGYDPAEKMSSGTSEDREWPALEQLQTEVLMPIGYAREDWNVIKSHAKSEQYKNAVDQFEQAELPAAYSGRAEQKETVVRKLREFSDAAAANASADELKAAWQDVNSALAALKGNEEAT